MYEERSQEKYAKFATRATFLTHNSDFLGFSDWYSHDSWNLAVLWHYLLPRIDRAENVSEVHPLRRDHPHHGMAL